MPYFIEIRNQKAQEFEDVLFPKQCLFCAKREVSTSFHRTFKHAKAFVPHPHGVHVFEKKYPVEYPSCGICRRRLTKLSLLGWLSLTLPWLIFFLQIFGILGTLGTYLNAEYIAYFALSSSALGIAAFIARWYWVSSFRLGYVADFSQGWFARHKSAAEKFAKLNRGECSFKWFVMRWR